MMLQSATYVECSNLKALICRRKKFVDGVCHIWRYGIILLTPNIYRHIEHTIHIMAAHFIKKLNIRGLQSTKCVLSHNYSTTLQNRDNLDDEYGEDFDVETCMEAEAVKTSYVMVRYWDSTEGCPRVLDRGQVYVKLCKSLRDLYCSLRTWLL